jgi:tRNA-(ms[2]io[6]A)-hydroxylase
MSMWMNCIYTWKKAVMGASISLVERLLFSAMIEAKLWAFQSTFWKHSRWRISCFYRNLMEKWRDIILLITYARKYGVGIDVEKRWREWLSFEENIIKIMVKNETIHG